MMRVRMSSPKHFIACGRAVIGTTPAVTWRVRDVVSSAVAPLSVVVALLLYAAQFSQMLLFSSPVTFAVL